MKWEPAPTMLAPHWIDPYYTWATKTDWRGFRRHVGQRLGGGGEPIETLRLLVKAASPELAASAKSFDWWSVADVYRERNDLTCFVATVSIANIHHLEGLPEASFRWELALPFRDAETTARSQPIGAYGETRAASATRRHNPFKTEGKSALRSPLSHPMMAAIDFGCPFFGREFLVELELKSRVVALWDQGAQADPKRKPWPWIDASQRYGQGRELRANVIQSLLNETTSLFESGKLIDEADAYARIDYLIDYDDARRRSWGSTHGCHVTSVAAGNRDPLAIDHRNSDAAGQSSIAFVQLPSLTAADSGGGSLSAQVLDGLHYVLDVNGGKAQRARAPTPIVVTLSYGSFAGPHDGSSLIEQAMDELIKSEGGWFVVVLGAGNARNASCHARRRIRKDRSGLLRVGLEEGDYTDTYVEVWFDPTPCIGRVEARVRTPTGDWSPWVKPDHGLQLVSSDDGRPVARLSFQRNPPNGGKPLLLLALAPTAAPADDDGPLAPTGTWEIEIQLKDAIDTEVVRFHAYVERDDPGWLGQGAQPRFEDQRIGDGLETLSSLATGRLTIAAGGFRLSDRRPATYSSVGSRASGAPPVIYAVCEESPALPNIRGSALRSGDSMRMNGTSVAAPVLARCIFNWMVPPGENAPRPLPLGDLTKFLTDLVEAEQTDARLTRREPRLRHGPVDSVHIPYWGDLE